MPDIRLLIRILIVFLSLLIFFQIIFALDKWKENKSKNKKVDSSKKAVEVKVEVKPEKKEPVKEEKSELKQDNIVVLKDKINPSLMTNNNCSITFNDFPNSLCQVNKNTLEEKLDKLIDINSQTNDLFQKLNNISNIKKDDYITNLKVNSKIYAQGYRDSVSKEKNSFNNLRRYLVHKKIESYLY